MPTAQRHFFLIRADAIYFVGGIGEAQLFSSGAILHTQKNLPLLNLTISKAFMLVSAPYTSHERFFHQAQKCTI